MSKDPKERTETSGVSVRNRRNASEVIPTASPGEHREQASVSRGKRMRASRER